MHYLRKTIRKHTVATKFRPGVLTRAYGKRHAVTRKPNMIVGDEYYRSSLHKLYPDRVNSQGGRIPGSKLLPRMTVQLKILLDRLQGTRLHEPPEKQHLVIFSEWARAQNKDRAMSGFIMPMLDTLQADPAYKKTLELDREPDQALFERFQKRLPSAMRRRRGGSADRTIARDARVFTGQLNRLMQTFGGTSITTCGNIALDDAAKYCAAVSGAPEQHARIELLMLAGYQGNQIALVKRVGEVYNYRKRTIELRHLSNLKKSDLQLEDYMALADALGGNPQEACTKQVSELIDMVKAKTSTGKKFRLFRALTLELKYSGNELKAEELKQSFDQKTTGQPAWESFSNISEWHCTVLHKALAALSANRKTWYAKRHEDSLKRTIGHCARTIRLYVKEHHEKSLAPGQDPFKWIIENATPGVFKDLVNHVAQNAASHNEKVRSANEGHHAEPASKDMIRFLKIGLSEYIPESCVIDLKLRKVLQGVENKRDPADPMIRRTFREDEIERMIASCDHDPRMKLFFLLLKEVGLRCGAICHMQYYSLVHDDVPHHPRHVCRIREKGRTLRSFVTSDTLKEAIRSYYTTLHERVEDMAPDKISELYIFGAKDLTKPLSDHCMRDWIRSVVKDAGITGVRVHPHAFRHTIVGQLIDAGNSMEVISKFMGHKSVDVTSNHYWVANVQELHDSIKNPITGAFQEHTRENDLSKLEVELLRQKKNKCMEIIHQYNNIVGRLAQAGGSAAEVQSQIFATMPGLGDILRILNEDEFLDDSDGDEDNRNEDEDEP